jgi:signal transduction histidine kinase
MINDLGYSEPEASYFRDNIGLLLHPDDQQKFADIHVQLRTFSDDELLSSEYRIKQKDGNWRWMLGVYQVFKRDENNVPTQMIGTSRNSTDQKKISESLQAQNEKLHALTEELRKKIMQLEEFTQIVSHNLRSPVGNIVTLLDHYEKTEDENEKEEYFKYLREASQDTFLTLNELNEVLRVKEDVYQDQHEISFDKVLKQVESMLRASITETDAVINRNLLVPTIYFPTIYLESLLLNLISNSIKYRHPKRKPVISISTFRDHESTVLEVSDTGLGIDMNRYGHQLFRMRKTFHSHPDARGVGLFISKNQVEAMGGEIRAHGKEGVGMTFIVKFKKDL